MTQAALLILVVGHFLWANKWAPDRLARSSLSTRTCVALIWLHAFACGAAIVAIFASVLLP